MMNPPFIQIPKLSLNKQQQQQQSQQHNVIQTTNNNNNKSKNRDKSITANSLLPKLVLTNDQQQQPTTGITILQNYQPSNNGSMESSANNTPTLSSTKKQLLGLIEIPEHLLIRDIIYVFQGIDGTFLKYNKKTDSYVIDDQIKLNNNEQAYISKPKRDLVYRLCEFGWLFKKTRSFIINNDFKNSGLTNQSFCSAIHDELTEFYRIIAILETQINKKYDIIGNINNLTSASPISISATSGTSSTTTTSELPFTEDNLTLIKLFVWIQSPLKKLKVLATCVDSIKVTMKGGEIISQIDKLSKHGDKDIQQLINTIMFKICQPLFSMIRLWLFKGEINDPYKEFFIRQHEKVDIKKTWSEKFAIVLQLIPSFISIPLSKKILAIGKSINYMKQFCNNFKEDKLDPYYYYNIDDDDDDDDDDQDDDQDDDEDFIDQKNNQEGENMVDEEEKLFKKEKKLLKLESKIIKEKSNNLNFKNKELLQDMIELVSRQSSERLLKIVLERFDFMKHISALKKYLLLGQGDFIQYLMDLVGEELSKPSKQIISNNNLVSSMLSAIDNSNAQFEDKDIIDRLDITLLDTKKENPTGWDVFSLSYNIELPLITIISKNDIERYNRIFHYMWSIKKVEYSLSSIWRNVRTCSKQLTKLKYFSGEIHKSHIIMNEMIHFISNFQYYLMFEVLECSWNNLKKFILEEATDLDQLIDAHHQYLQDICMKSFLSNSPSAYESFKNLLHIISKFTDLQNTLINFSTISATDNKYDDNVLKKQQSLYQIHLNKIYQDYTNAFSKFQDEIQKVQISQDLNPISLKYMLDFNEYYKNKKN